MSTTTEDAEVWSLDESDPSDQECASWCNESPPRDDDSLHEPEHDVKARAIATWLMTFLMFIQMKYHLTANLLNLMFKFFRVFLSVLGRFSAFVLLVAKCFPVSLYKAQQQCQISSEVFCRYVTCRKCHKLYFFQDCIEGFGTHKTAKSCTHFIFSRQCNTPLLKSVELRSGKKMFYPHLTYCYLGMETSLQRILNRPDLVSSCENVRNRPFSSHILSDVWDGRVWQDFQVVDGKPFLSEPYSYALMLNVDWYQPYKHLSYSIGVIYLAILNLPRHLRYKVENIILVGLMPGPHEPKLNVNSYLEPLVKELKTFWGGVELHIANMPVSKVVRCALVCASCDLPAGRKVCGFLGHMAKYGCSKCFKQFSGSVGRMDYSGFNREEWIKRTNERHRQLVQGLARSTSKSALQRNEYNAGCRYSVLLELPYFDAPRMCALDPMHNLFLGIAKHYIHHIWIDMGIITSANFGVIQDRMNRMLVPPDIGRIPQKIQSSFASFTADQLKNWVIYYSPITLHGILTGNDFQCWQHFVLACRILCSQRVTLERLRIADALILRFCKRTEQLYGRDKITPNMHMSCHLCECAKDFGPLAAFWLFPFERYNGILGKLPNNNRSIEIQLMKRFIADQSILTLPKPHDFHDDFDPLLQSNSERGSLGSYSAMSQEDSLNHVELPNHYQVCAFTSSDIDDLKQLFSKLYNVPVGSIYPNTSYKRYTYCYVNGKTVGSYRSAFHNSSIVIAKWIFDIFGPSNHQHEIRDTLEERPVKVNFILKHAVTIEDTVHSHILFSVSWFKHYHDDRCEKPVTLWESSVFEISGIHSFIPAHFMQSRAVCLVDRPEPSEGTVLYVCSYLDF